MVSNFSKVSGGASGGGRTRRFCSKTEGVGQCGGGGDHESWQLAVKEESREAGEGVGEGRTTFFAVSYPPR